MRCRKDLKCFPKPFGGVVKVLTVSTLFAHIYFDFKKPFNLCINVVLGAVKHWRRKPFLSIIGVPPGTLPTQFNKYVVSYFWHFKRTALC